MVKTWIKPKNKRMNASNTPGEDAFTHHTHINSSAGWWQLNVGEWWAYRDLFMILMLRDVRVRYKQTVLGVLWVILQPLTAAGVFSIIFGQFADLPSQGRPYALYVFAAMLPWNIVAGALQRGGVSLLGDARLISKVYFPRVIIPIASASAVLVDFVVAFAVGTLLTASYRIYPSWQWLCIPLMVGLAMTLTLGIALLVSALNVYYRDFMYALPFVIQVWMYASPIAYSADIVPAKFQTLYALNPMVGIINGFRWALLDSGDFPWRSIVSSAITSLVLFVVGLLVFQRIEDTFADVI